MKDIRREQHWAYYESLDVKKLTSSEIVAHLAKSEEEGMKYDFQPAFSNIAYSVIRKLAGSAMKDLTQAEVETLFYYLSIQRQMFKFKEKHYPAYLNAMERACFYFSDKDGIYAFSFWQQAILLLGVEARNRDKLKTTSFEDFEVIRRFIDKASLFTNYPGMRKKHASFDVFMHNEVLLERVRQVAPMLFEYMSLLSAGCLTLLLKDSDPQSKQALSDLHATALTRDRVWKLGSFYKDFRDTDANRQLLEDLYKQYDKDWIDEYSN
jgi:hypothetical protein